jgi:DNA (cytosine-5)-methyltransferase 1
MTKFMYVSLFSGIGGFETALNRLGGGCVLASEIDKYANKAYEVLYGHPTAGDVTKIAAEDVPDHDILVGGFPCQAFSVAGKRLGFDDTRGTLFFEIARIAKVKKPKLLLLENVKGLVGHDKGRTLDTIVQTLCDIGYTVDFNVLNSKYFGVPQNRERIFIVGVLDGAVEPWKISGNDVVAKGKKRIQQLDGVKTFNFDWPVQEAVTTRIRDILEDNVAEKYYLSEDKTAKLIDQLALNYPQQFSSGNDIAYCLDSNYTKGTAPGDVGKGRRTHVVEEIRPALTPDRIEKRQNGRRFKDNDEEAFTIGNYPKYRIRKLTPLECLRLQGFPDEYHTKLVVATISDSQLYKMAGNAVTVNVIDAIGKRLIPLLGKESESITKSNEKSA